MKSDRGADVFELAYTCFSIGSAFFELEEGLLLLKCCYKVDLTILYLVNLEGGFNDIFDVNVWFGVGIFIYITSKAS